MAHEIKCRLCGGKLDKSLRCISCGLDNSKNDEALTHIHEKKETVNYDYAKYTGRGKKSNKLVSLAIIFGGLILVIIFLSSLVFQSFKFIEEALMDIGIGEMEPDYMYEEMQPDNSSEWGLPSGFYEIGVHIPAGKYLVSVGADEYAGIGVYELLEDELPQRESYHFGPLEAHEYEIEFKEGTYIQIATHSAIHFHSQTDYGYNEDEIININGKDSYHAMGRMVAGQDFPAGVYDVYFTSAIGNGKGYVDLKMMNQSGSEFMWSEILYFDETGGDGYYASFPFTPGSEFVADEGLKGMLLVPSYGVSQSLYEITWGADSIQ